MPAAFLHSSLALTAAAIALVLMALALLAWRRAGRRIGWVRGGVVAGLVAMSAYGGVVSWRLAQFQLLMDEVKAPAPESERAEPMAASQPATAR